MSAKQQDTEHILKCSATSALAIILSTRQRRWHGSFLTETLEMPKELLWVTIYENDDEAYDIWTKEVGVDPSHIVRLGKEDNFWEHGQGPCGPCSEIYFDRGEKYDRLRQPGL